MNRSVGIRFVVHIAVAHTVEQFRARMKFWGSKVPPAWIREIADDRPRPLVVAEDVPHTVPKSGDIVLKPFIDSETYKQLFRVESFNTHDLLDGPFESVRQAMECAFEFGVTSRLAVWLDYSDDPNSHDLDNVPLYDSDLFASSQSIA